MKVFLNMDQVNNLAKGEVSDEVSYDSVIKPNARTNSKGRYRAKPSASAAGSLSSQQARAARVVDVPVLRRAAMDLLARHECNRHSVAWIFFDKRMQAILIINRIRATITRENYHQHLFRFKVIERNAFTISRWQCFPFGRWIFYIQNRIVFTG